MSLKTECHEQNLNGSLPSAKARITEGLRLKKNYRDGLRHKIGA